MLHNSAVDLNTLTLDKDKSMGYAGLNNSIAIEFDFNIDLDSDSPHLTDPGQPHLSVQYSNPLSADSDKSLGMAWLDYDLTKSGQHRVKMQYIRALEDITDFNSLSFTWYGSQHFETDTYNMGLLKVFIDDMDRSVLEIPINLGYLVAHDDLDVANPSTGANDGSMACKSYVSMTSTTSNTTDQSAAFQILGKNIRFIHI